MNSCKIFILCILFTGSLIAQQSEVKKKSLIYFSTNYFVNKNLTKIKPLPKPSFKKEINYYGLGAVTILGVGSFIAARTYFENTWWSDEKVDFHFHNDWDYALGADKFGHFFGGYAISQIFSSVFSTANLEEEQVYLYSSLFAVVFQTYIEIEDGFSPRWGFSPGDAIANTLGASYRYLQYKFPYLNNIKPKISYYPSDEFRDGKIKGSNITDDYSGQKFWLSMKLNKIIPEMKNYWPDWLMFATGYGIRDYKSNNMHREFYLALDIDIEELPLYGGFWNFIKSTLNLFHVPMPGLRITQDGTFFEIIF